MGGVPRRTVFENAIEVGRREGSQTRVSDLFRRFAAHYGFNNTFTNPYPATRKATAKRGRVPQKEPVRARVVVPRCAGLQWADPRGQSRPQRGQVPLQALYARARAARGGRGGAVALPPAAFSRVRCETRRYGKQGVPAVGGLHRYLAGPAHLRREVAAELGAFDATVCDASSGDVVAAYEREWGDAPTDSFNPTLQPGCCTCGQRAGGAREAAPRHCPSSCPSWTRRLRRTSPPNSGCCATRSPSGAGPPQWRACYARRHRRRKPYTDGPVRGDRPRPGTGGLSTRRKSTWASTTGF